ncbi:MAG: universal stress protein [Cytophagales bacterium]
MKNISKILVPVDFSECSINALDYALKLSEYTGGMICVLHAYHVPYAFPEAGNAISGETVRNIELNVEEEFDVLKEQFSAYISKFCAFKKVASFGIDAINEELKKDNYDLIVMGTKGSSGLSEIIIGSVAANVIEEAKAPVICVPENAVFDKINNIVFACDYEEVNEPREIDSLKFIAKKFNARIHLVNVKEKSKAGHFEEAMYFESLFASIPHTHNTSRFRDFEAGINDFIESNKVELLAIMPRKKNVFKKIFGSSHTRKMAYHTKLPMLAFHE